MRTVAEMLAALALIAFMVFSFSPYAATVAEADGGDVKITLTDEPCALMAMVSNLRNRATWTEAGKVTEGCWATGRGLVMLFFADRSVVTVPAQAFHRVSGV